MTFEEFDATRWDSTMRARYRGKLHNIISVDLFERLVGLSDDETKLRMVRCENVELVNQPK